MASQDQRHDSRAFHTPDLNQLKIVAKATLGFRMALERLVVRIVHLNFSELPGPEPFPIPFHPSDIVGHNDLQLYVASALLFNVALIQ